jgi:hypothetical protein
VVADLAGWFGGAASYSYVASPPYRALDTRAHGGPLSPRRSTMETLQYPPGLPENYGVVMNTTVTDTKASGYLSITARQTFPDMSSLNWTAGQTLANLTVTAPDSPGLSAFYFYNGSNGTTDVLGDVLGYFAP